MEMPIKEKYCRYCETSKPSDNFDNKRRMCKACRSEQNHKNYVKRRLITHPPKDDTSSEDVLNATSKTCSKCQTLQPLDNYNRCSGRLRAECKNCRREYYLAAKLRKMGLISNST
jgi:hypothetical protein